MRNKDGSITIDVDLSTEHFDTQIKNLTYKLNDLIDDYEIIKKLKPYEGQVETLNQLENEIEQTSNQIVNLRNQQKKTQQESNKGWNKVLNSFKKIGLRMLGLVSVYGLLSKASSAYLSQDVELSEKLESIWAAFGSFFEPIISRVGTLLLKTIGYVNEFLKALTGIDFIARANAKALDKQSKAMKNLNKQTYDFDVIRTQQEGNGSGGEYSGGLIEIPQLDDRVVSKLKEFANFLKDNKELIKDFGLALAITFGANAIGKLLKNISTLIGSESGLTGIKGLTTLLGTLATAILITIAIKGIKEAIEQTKELNEALNQEKELINNNKDGIDKISKSYWDLDERTGATTEQTDIFARSLSNASDEAIKHIQQMEKDKSLVGALTGANKKLSESQQIELDLIRLANENYKKLYDQGKLNEQQKYDYKKSLENEINATRLLKGDVTKLQEEYQKLNGKVYTSTIRLDADTSSAEKKLSLLDHWKRGWETIFGGGSGSTQKYAAGGIVTQPTRAIIGEAGYPEAIVPMTDDYLSTLASLISQYGGSSGNGVVNVYLDGRLIQRQVTQRESQYNFSTNK